MLVNFITILAVHSRCTQVDRTKSPGSHLEIGFLDLTHGYGCKNVAQRRVFEPWEPPLQFFRSPWNGRRRRSGAPSCCYLYSAEEFVCTILSGIAFELSCIVFLLADAQYSSC